MDNKINITTFGIFASIITATVGIATFSYPNELSSLAGTDGWLIIIAGGIISCAAVLIMIRLIKDNKWNNLVIILKNSFGKFVGSILALVFAGYCIFSMCIGLRTFIEVMKMFLLEKTPTEFLIVVTILCGVYVIRGGLENIVKFNEIAFWLMFVPIIIVLPLLLSNADFTNIFPVMAGEPANYIKSMPVNIYIFKGFEIVFLFIPFIKAREKAAGVSILSMIFISIFYIIIFIFTLAVLSKYLDNIFLWPTITMIKAIKIPGTFIESWDGVVMTLWILFYFTTFINSFYFASDIVKNVFKFSSIKMSYIIVLPFLYLGALYPENLLELNNLMGAPYQIYTVLMIIVLPLLSLIVSSVRNKRAVALVLLVCILFTGCWDKVEIDNRSFISTIGIDAGEDIGNDKELKKLKEDKSNNELEFKKIRVTFGAPDISKLGPQKSAASQDIYVTADAVSMEDALDKASSKISRHINYGHIKLLVLSSDLMEYPDTVREIIDYFQRQAAFNKMMYVFVAQGKAEEYLKFKPATEQNIEKYINGLIQNSDRNSTVLPVTLNEMLMKLSENGNAIIPALKYDKDKNEMMITGIGIIKNYKLAGYLSQNETSAIEMLRGKLKGGKKTVFIQGRPFDISIDSVERKITLANADNVLQYNVDLYLEGQVKGYYIGGKNITADYINAVENDFNKSIKDECEEVIKITQKTFLVDPIGFREVLEKYHPGIWKKKKDIWDKAYSDAVINVNVHTKIRRIGVSK